MRASPAMRDPLAPLPSPTQDPSYWQCTVTPRRTAAEYPPRLHAALQGPGDGPPRATRASETSAASAASETPTSDQGAAYEPLRLLGRGLGDTHGIDRRSRRRHPLARPRPEHGAHRLVAASHRPLHLALGLTCAHGWALVHTLSVSPDGVLLHLLDLMAPGIDRALVSRGHAALRQLAPLLDAPLRTRACHHPGSPLATIGGCLLAPRVIADLAAWASAPGSRRGSCRDPSAAHALTLLLPTAQGPARLEGELTPMTDPRPEVLAVALSQASLATLRRAATAPAT